MENVSDTAQTSAPATLLSDGYTLKHSYKTAAGTLLTYVPTRRLTVKDLRSARKQSAVPADWDDILISAMTGLVPEDLDAMDLEDYQVLQKRFQSFAGLAA
ncbi:phage tail assembly protein [Citrobacter portucalensis]|uniref:phage tail assembly protein n=1 Tax=Citrobacter portucalensis TaxID=1639133 RepID=UPI00226B18BD|nr:phage tail assembly protein [Citrobacter portucalensis]MCX9038481.1 phage tail assembly protein [Citrobacter portucalensis]